MHSIQQNAGAIRFSTHRARLAAENQTLSRDSRELSIDEQRAHKQLARRTCESLPISCENLNIATSNGESVGQGACHGENPKDSSPGKNAVYH